MINRKNIEEQILRERKIISEGVSDEALDLLKKQFMWELPAFQFRENGRPIQGDGMTLSLMAATRDGAREVIQYIEAMKGRSFNQQDTL